MPTITLTTPQPDIALLTLDMPDKGANVLSQAVLKELAGHLDQLEKRRDLAGLIIRSGKPGMFIAGADLREFAAAVGQASSLPGRQDACPTSRSARSHETLAADFNDLSRLWAVRLLPIIPPARRARILLAIRGHCSQDLDQPPWRYARQTFRRRCHGSSTRNGSFPPPSWSMLGLATHSLPARSRE